MLRCSLLGLGTCFKSVMLEHKGMRVLSLLGAFSGGCQR